MNNLDPVRRGLVAGFIGTVALTASQRTEMRLTGRPASDLPAQVAEGMFRISSRGRGRVVVAFATHWLNNTACGLFRTGGGVAGLDGGAAVGAIIVGYLGVSTLMFRRIGLTPPLLQSVRQCGLEVVHASVFAVATNLAYERLSPPTATIEP